MDAKLFTRLVIDSQFLIFFTERTYSGKRVAPDHFPGFRKDYMTLQSIFTAYQTYYESQRTLNSHL
jgi:hypothetical protein